MTLESNKTNQHAIVIWLLICCVVIFVMVILGGVTRLTGSGLSMVEWKPIMGVLPPLSQAEWLQSFQLYQQFPEYQINNLNMSLGEYKSIFWFEYAHRLLGRSIGIIFFIPMVIFLGLKKVDASLKPKLWFMFILGGLQGLLGWYMVKSGLVNDPHVSQYRLVAHLGLAVVIYGYIFSVAIGLLHQSSEELLPPPKKLIVASIALSCLAFITILSGGFVAGLKAGLIFNTFPLMDGQLIPDGMTALQPIWKNIFENMISVQFNHRVLALTLFSMVCVFWFLSRRVNTSRDIQIAIELLMLVAVVQVTLGITTLLLIVPVPLAAAHQAGALLLFTVLLYISRRVWQ